MPIRIPDQLPATAALEAENIFVMTEHRALSQDIRPLRLLLLNLMPTKITTETQILRKLSNTPLQIDIELLRMASHEAQNVSAEHLDAFYTTFEEVKERHYDGLIITGAPVELLDFEQVDYWDELCAIMEWATTNVHSTFHICWGAQAGIYYHYGVPKRELGAKMFGVFSHTVEKPTSPLVRGFDDQFMAPHSRYTEVRREDIEAHPQLEVVASSDKAGVYIAKSIDSRNFFVFGHPEYDRETLQLEYERDVKRGLDISVPANYFPNDDPTQQPVASWRAQAQLLYTNWLNYYVYQTVPYDITRAGDCSVVADFEKSLAAEKRSLPDAADQYSSRNEGSLKKPVSKPGSHSADNPYLRAPNEDDDGYDPYSDLREEPPLFERDPWN